jgi:hypothetical protein
LSITRMKAYSMHHKIVFLTSLASENSLDLENQTNFSPVFCSPSWLSPPVSESLV